MFLFVARETLLITEEQYEKHFLFTAEPTNLLQPFRSCLAAADFANMMASAPLMIIGGIILKRT